jgi:beta-mannosidase
MALRRHSRRRFLAVSAAATAAACIWKPTLAAAEAGAKNRQRLDLNGAWQLRRIGEDNWTPATVPGCVHTDLLSAEKIPDPFFRDNERTLRWIGEADWIYRRTFDVPDAILHHDRVMLRCEGLDTLAVVRINGSEVGRADNMFRIWEFDAKPALQVGENVIEVLFASPLPLMKERQAARTLFEWAGPHEPQGRAWVRKEPCNFGWDWGPVLITCGIWRGISLVALDQARLADMQILQDHSVAGKVGLQVEVNAEVVRAASLMAAIAVSQNGKTLSSGTVEVSNGSGRHAMEIKKPKLWWPAGMGEQPLYEVRVELRDAGGAVIDRTTRRFGLRTLKLLPGDKKNSLRFEVNGVPFFAKGANWIPADVFANRVTPEILRRYVADAVAVNMNSLRFWGGGYYEDDALFDACDELGICVWLDFKFACSTYPVFDGAFMDNVRLEARDQLRRLRHHPCIAVWCGNNEISLMTKDEWSDQSMGRADYDKLFKQLLGGQVKELAPQANYVSGSPDCGDVHYWQVWHGGKPFEDYRTLTGFMSEFGFQSFPEPKTVHAYTTEEDRASVMTPVMQWHQRSNGNGNERIKDTTLRYFNAPKNFDSALWLSQVLQGCGITVGAEHWRRTMPKSMGCLFWQYNDCWPVASWSSVDYFGRWKALHYLARRFYAPLLVSALENAAKGTVEIHISSDCMEACAGKLIWQVTDATGKTLTGGEAQVEMPPRQSRKIKTLNLRKQIKAHGQNNVLVWLKLEVAGQTVSDNLACFVPPKDLPLADPQLKTTVAETADGFLVNVTGEKPALWCWLNLDEVDAKYSDNFVHITAEQPAQFRVRPARPISKSEFVQALRVHSLFDTYSATPAKPWTAGNSSATRR